MLLDILLIICGVTLISLALVVVYSNYHSTINRWLGAFIISGFMWLLANYLANNAINYSYNLFYSRLTFVGAALIPYTFVIFCYKFLGHKLNYFKNILFIIPIIFLIIVSPTDLIVKSVSSYTLNPGPIYFIFIVCLIVYFTIGIKSLFFSYKKATGIQRQQLFYMLLGTGLTIVIGIIANGILPILGYIKAASLGPSFILFFALFTTIAIVKHRLLDIRVILLRSLSYAGAILIISFIYGIIILGLSQQIFHTRLSFFELIFMILGTSFSALTFPKIKEIFTILTSKLFYRDSYDVQVFLDQFNKILVSTFELNLMLTKISDLIELNIKPVYCLFVIKETNNNSRRFIGTKNYLKFHNNNIDIVNNVTKRLHSKIIATDLLEDKYSDDRRLLLKHNISIINKLASSNSAESVGYLVLGPKKSGNMYSSQDIKILEIIANELVVAIQNALHTEDIENFNLTLQEKIKEATHRLRATNEKLRALDEAKDDFVSMASHQLRTPLTSVKGNISLVLDGDAGKISSLQKQLLEQAFASSQRMVYLIADLLNVSRLKTGKFIIEQSAVDLASVIEEEVKQLVETAKSRNLELNYQKPDKITHLMLDETKTRQVIMNFVDNAIYYTPSGGRIDVILSENNNDVECRVVDNGIGVPKSEQPHLFTKFYRAANARKARPDGTGLGLFMAKKVIIAEGGAIIFDTQEGKGSTFGFSFPKAVLAVKTSSVQNQPQEQAAVAI